MSLRKGDVVPIHDVEPGGGYARFRVTGFGKHGVHGVWLDGPLAGRPAYVVTELVKSRGRPVDLGRRGSAPTPPTAEEAESDA